MKIVLHASFKKSYTKRIKPHPKLTKKVEERTTLFQKDPDSPLLRDHALQGEKSSLRAFSITGDIRIIYEPIDEDSVLFIDIGTHNQVY